MSKEKLSSNKKAIKADTQKGVDTIAAGQHSRRRKSIFIFLVFGLASLVVDPKLLFPLVAAASARKTEKPESLYTAEISPYPTDKFSSYSSVNSILSTSLKLPECQRDSSWEKCVDTVCDLTAKDLNPLNKPREGENIPRREDIQKLDEAIKAVNINAKKATRALVDRADAKKIVSTEEGYNMRQYLIKREWLIQHSTLPNCAGGAAKATVLLSEQPLTKQREAKLGMFGGTLKSNSELRMIENMQLGNIQHTVLNITQGDKYVICDPFNLEKGFERQVSESLICTDKQIQIKKPPICGVYQEKNWHKTSEKGLDNIQAPLEGKLSKKEKKFYRQEIKRQDNLFLELQGTNSKERIDDSSVHVLR